MLVSPELVDSFITYLMQLSAHTQLLFLIVHVIVSERLPGPNRLNSVYLHIN